MARRGVSGGKVRCFAALELPAELRDEIGGLVARRGGAAGNAGVRWTAPETWHLTLKFIGDIESARLGEFTAAVEAAAAGSGPVAVRIGAPILFPFSSRPRIVALEVEERVAALERMTRF